MTKEIIQTEEEIQQAWELLLAHVRGCEDWGNGCRVDGEAFIRIGKKEFIVIVTEKE